MAVCVSIVGKNFDEIVQQLDLVEIVRSNALKWISEHGASAPLHHYRIDGGKVNAKPFPLECLDQAMQL